MDCFFNCTNVTSLIWLYTPNTMVICLPLYFNNAPIQIDSVFAMFNYKLYNTTVYLSTIRTKKYCPKTLSK